jgi:hypothetical protein
MNDSNPFSPREFLKAKRPERFSDSVLENKPVLDRTLLEYHLGTLTNRSQETDFQTFARHLAEKEICPNLLPQTGPTGGGDSKVDSETYPVADDLSLAWYVGIGREASSERWAFAFSAKADWRAKARSDVKKIADTKRGYAKAFFISNQFVRDRDRAEVEDELRKLYSLDVRILDRSWILDKVFVGRHQSLAIDDLRLQPTLRTQIRKGPRDLEREQALDDLEANIQAATQAGQFGFQFVDDCIQAAKLSRGLERSRTETDGRFIRAERAAAQYGTDHQQLRCNYEYAWTACFWYEDFGLCAQLYGVVEGKAKGTHNAYDLELLSNLWKVLFATVQAGRLDAVAADLDNRSQTLIAELERLAGEQDRPSSALHARSLQLFMQMLLDGPDGIDGCLEALRAVILDSRGLVGFPLEPLVESLTEIGGYLGTYPSYQALHETIVEVVAAREGEVAAAKLLVRRGAQQLEADRPVEAVRLLGRALAKLYKHESRHEMVQALALCGAAYERLGLLWAARGTTLTAASIATSEFWTYADVTTLQASCYNRMKWLELQLGRVPHVLAWQEVDLVTRGILAQQGYDPKRLGEGEADFNGIFGILMLRTDFWELKWLTTLPDVLDPLELYIGADALRYALGHEDNLPEEITKPGTESGGPLKFFLRLRDQPAGKELPATPLFCDGQTLTLSSIILGCQVNVECDNEQSNVALAESILAALEAFLASGLVDRMAALEAQLTIRVRKTSLCEGPFSFELRERDGRPHMDIGCGDFDPNSMKPEVQNLVKSRLGELLAMIIARVFMFADFEQTLNKLFGDDRAMERAVGFTSSFVVLGNVLGKAPRTEMSRWSDPKAREYPLKRSKAWDADHPKIEMLDKRPETSKSRQGSEEDIAAHIRLGRVKHSDVEAASPIRVRLWDEAGWVGNAFVYPPGKVPVFAPVFMNAGAAGKIFSGWRKDFGEVDLTDRLRVTVIRGIRKDRPYWYRVIFGGNPTISPGITDVRLQVIMARVHTMEPSSDDNLNAFLSSYEKMGRYTLAHCIRDGDSEPVFVRENYIGKFDLHLRNAWEIGRNDLDSVGILPSDDPIIPDDQPDAPVIELLRLKRQREEKR